MAARFIYMEWFFLAFGSAALAASAAISEKKALFDIDALEFSFILSVLNMLFSLPFFFGVEIAGVTSDALVVLFIKTILSATAFWCVMLSIKNLEISEALPLLVLTPGVVALFAFIILGENLSAAELAGMFLLLTGTYILEMRSKSEMLKPFTNIFRSKNHLFVVAALFLFTATSLMDRALVTTYKLTPYAFMAFQHIFTAVVFFIIVAALRKSPVKAVKHSDNRVLKWILIVAVLTICYRYFQIEAIKLAPVALVLSVKRLSVFFAAVLGGRLFNETGLLRKSIATLIMIVGSYFVLTG